MPTRADVTTDGDWRGFVLAGGASRRMGRDKSLVEVDGVALVTRVVRALDAAGAAEVTVVAGSPRITRLGHRQIPDTWPGEGPVGGIVTALRTAEGAEVAAILSCDVVDPSPANITALVERVRGGTDVAVATLDGRAQWLHAAWDPAVADRLQRRFADGVRRVDVAVDGLDVALCEVPEPARLRDADTPEELEAILRGKRPGR